MFTYSPATHPGAQSQVFLFTDAALSTPATISDANGVPFPLKTFGLRPAATPANRLELNPDGSWPVFTATAAPLWYQASTGRAVKIVPALSYSAPVAVTGSRGSATAATLESLIQALIAAGVPITDNTTP